MAFKSYSTLVLIVVLIVPSALWAQEGDANNEGNAEKPYFDTKGTFRNLLIGSAVGGILGLSTLSFYDEPRKNLKNIPIGVAAGAITAALYTSYQVAKDPDIAHLNIWGIVPEWKKEKALSLNYARVF